MKELMCILFLLFLPGCGILDHSKEDELAQLTETVLKKGKGVDIEVKPIPVEKDK